MEFPSTNLTGVAVDVANVAMQPTDIVDVAALVVGMLSGLAIVEEAAAVKPPVRVDAPVTLIVPAVAKLPVAAVVVAKPFTLTFPLSQLWPLAVRSVVEALVRAA